MAARGFPLPVDRRQVKHVRFRRNSELTTPLMAYLPPPLGLRVRLAMLKTASNSDDVPTKVCDGQRKALAHRAPVLTAD